MNNLIKIIKKKSIRLFKIIKSTSSRFKRKFRTDFYKILPYKDGINRKAREKKIIVSLTSYPRRFYAAHIAIKSMLYQTCKADEIILYLNEEVKDIEIPEELKNLKKYGLQIEYRPHDIKPHKKYYYAMLEHPNDIIITIDDDVIYENTLIEKLYNSYKKYPTCVSAKRVHRMKKNKKYKEWEGEVSNLFEPSHSLISTGVGGVLYPPSILPKETFDIEKITKYCLGADDIWLKFMELKSDIKVVYVEGKRIHPLPIWNVQAEGLVQENVENEKNDIYIKNLEEIFNIKINDFCDY